jgi:hypothetical protein
MAARRKRKVSRFSGSGQARQPRCEEVSQGCYFDLLALFRKLNGEFFSNRLPAYKVVWGRRRRERPATYFVFASIREEDRVIRVHPLLDAAFVPVWFMEYVLFHEMLHAVVPDEVLPSGRRRVHTVDFRERERAFPYYERARRWEARNLLRFLR